MNYKTKVIEFKNRYKLNYFALFLGQNDFCVERTFMSLPLANLILN